MNESLLTYQIYKQEFVEENNHPDYHDIVIIRMNTGLLRKDDAIGELNPNLSIL